MPAVEVGQPVSATADFNGDGLLDVAIFDAGNTGQHPTEGGYFGGEPHLLLSDGGAWSHSWALRDAVEYANPDFCWPECTTVLHAKHATAGDHDGDGDIDMYVESAGGYGNPNPHVMVNHGTATFSIDASDTRRADPVVWGPGDWRYASQLLVDLDGDGFDDLVMGQLRRIDNNQDELASVVWMNDGTGQFPAGNATALPYAAWNEGWTFVKTIAAHDLDADGEVELLLVHERGMVEPDPDEETSTGRYLQVLSRDGAWTDVTDDWFPDQSATGAIQHPDGGANRAMPHSLHLGDLDGDGDEDLLLGGVDLAISDASPAVYLRTEAGFQAEAADLFTSGAPIGNNAEPIDLDGDGRLDLVWFDFDVGEDGTPGTGDERTEVKSVLRR